MSMYKYFILKSVYKLNSNRNQPKFCFSNSFEQKTAKWVMAKFD